MSEKIVQLNEEVIKGQLKELVRESVEETLNELLEAEAEKLTQAGPGMSAMSSARATAAATTTATSPPLPRMSLSRYPSSRGSPLKLLLLSGIAARRAAWKRPSLRCTWQVRRGEHISEALWGSKVSSSTISELNKKAYVHNEDWRNRPLQGGRHPYVNVDEICLLRNWGG